MGGVYLGYAADPTTGILQPVCTECLHTASVSPSRYSASTQFGAVRVRVCWPPSFAYGGGG